MRLEDRSGKSLVAEAGLRSTNMNPTTDSPKEKFFSPAYTCSASRDRGVQIPSNPSSKGCAGVKDAWFPRQIPSDLIYSFPLVIIDNFILT
jgi:hypothetical protein